MQVKAEPGARVVPYPVASSSEEAATETFYRACKKAEHDQRVENLRAARKRDGTPAATVGQPYRAAAPQPAASQPPEALRDPHEAGATAAREALQLTGASLSDLMRERHGLAGSPTAPRSASEQADDDFARGAAAASELLRGNDSDRTDDARGAAAARELLKASSEGPSLADHMRARHGVEPVASAPAAQSLTDKMRARHGLSADDRESGAAEAAALLKIVGR